MVLNFVSFCNGDVEQIGKIPIDEIKKDLTEVGISEQAVEELLQVISIKSLSELEGCINYC